MNTDEILATIAACESMHDLRLIEKAVRDRQRIVSDAAWKIRCDGAWEISKKWWVGMPIYCAASGTFVGGPIQRGDKLRIIAIQPRARRIWARLDGEKQEFCFEVGDLARYKFQPAPPDDPMDEESREYARETEKIFERF